MEYAVRKMSPYIEVFKNKKYKDNVHHDFITCQCELPEHKSGIGGIEWSKTIGYVFDFSYCDFVGVLTIVDYDMPNYRIYFKIDGYDDVYHITTQAFANAGLRNVIKIRYHEYDIGDVVANKKIIDMSYSTIHSSIEYKYKCLNDGYVGYVYENNLKRNTGVCPVCQNRIVVPGVNDIPTIAPWMVDYFQGGYDEAKQYTPGSNKRFVPRCPHCGTISKKSISISTLYRTKVLSCKCSDGTSYPEKCMLSLLDMIGVDYLYQCGHTNLQWIKNKYAYDFYIKDLNMMIETNGGQHYEESSSKSSWQSLQEIQSRDFEKKCLAYKNGIEYYVSLDCRESNIEWFKTSVMNSILPTILKFSDEDIDWDEIDISSTKNIVKDICVYHDEHPHLTLDEMASIFKVNKRLITKYYHKGDKYGWCKYNEQEMRWVGHFDRNTHYIINGEYFYNQDDITDRSLSVFGEYFPGSSISTRMRNGSTGLFKGKYDIRKVDHKEYLENNKIYPSFISQKIVDGLLEKYS